MSTGLAMLGKPRTPGTRGQGLPLRGQCVESETGRKQNNQDLLLHIGSNSEANMPTTQRKPWQGQFLTIKHGHLTA